VRGAGGGKAYAGIGSRHGADGPQPRPRTAERSSVDA